MANRNLQAPLLLLFDIDGTLMDTGGAGLDALLDAAENCFGVERGSLPPLDLAGATDAGVVRTLFEGAGQVLTEEAAAAYHAAYLMHLHRRMNGPEFCGVLLPGVRELLEALSPMEEVHLGLLTGNVRRGAEIKLQRFGIHDCFLDGAFGDDAEHRNHLAPIALERMKRASGADLTAGRTIIIGDTPKDIACADALGARCLAVATGRFSEDDLSALRPWKTLPHLAATAEVASLLTS